MPEIKWNADLYNTKHHFVYKYGEDVVKWFDPKEDESILDVGCGTGQLTNEIKKFGTVVTGIDASFEMIEKAKQNFPDINFLVVDATDFSFIEKFDAVFSNATLHWINEQQKAIDCIYKNLKPGGRFVFEMGGKHNIESIHNAIKIAFINEGLENKISTVSNYFPSVAEQSKVLENAGFTITKVAYFKRPTELNGEDGMRNWIVQFCDFFFKQTDISTKEKIINNAVEQLKTTNYKSGIWYADYVRLRIKAIKE